MQVNNQLKCLILYSPYQKRLTISKMHQLKFTIFFQNKVLQNQDICKTMVFGGSPKDELKLSMADFELFDKYHTVLHNFLWFHLTKGTKNNNKLTFFSYILFWNKSNYNMVFPNSLALQ